jgi:hypothetical protein
MKIVRLRNSERLTELTRPIGQFHIAPDAATATCPHQFYSREGLEGANENGARLTFPTGNGVEAPVHPVDEVDVRDARRPVQRLRAPRPTGGGMTGEIVLADVGLGFNDSTARDPLRGPALEDHAEEIARDELRRAIVEGCWKGGVARAARRTSCYATAQLSDLGVVFRARARRCAVLAAVFARDFLAAAG